MTGPAFGQPGWEPPAPGPRTAAAPAKEKDALTALVAEARDHLSGILPGGTAAAAARLAEVTARLVELL